MFKKNMIKRIRAGWSRAWRLSALSHSILGRGVAFVNILWATFLWRMWKKVPLTHVHFSFGGDDVRLAVQEPGDFAVCEEVFIKNEYAHRRTQDEPKVIVDFGSNIGVTVCYFNALYPAAQIYAFEPDERARNILALNVVNKPVRVFPCGVSDRDGVLALHADLQNSFSSSFKSRDGAEMETRIVDVCNPVRALGAHGVTRIDILKFDIEGMEDVAVNEDLLSMCEVVLGEFHEDLVSCSKDEFKARFAGFEICSFTQITSARYLVYAERKN